MHLMRWADKRFPPGLRRALLFLGTAIALGLMRKRRAGSAEYLRAVLGREPHTSELHEHFMVFTEALIQRLRLSGGEIPAFYFADPESGKEFEALCRSSTPGLFGTFHVGQSDLLGCMLSDFGRRIGLVRHRVGNALDVETMERQFARWVKILWINDPTEFLFELKQSLQQGISVGLQCDRTDYGGKMAAFEFLGARRLFPITIYHLARMFDYPVAFAFAGQWDAAGNVPAVVSPIFRASEHEKPILAAHEHFQGVLKQLEAYLREHPYVWFNFGGLNPGAES
jgi:predicted LPLAT superfamily acyltransferase